MPPFKVVIFTSTAIAGAALTAAGPNLHYSPKLECNLHAEWCGMPDVAAPDDEPAPKRAPPMIFSQPVAGFTSTATGTSLASGLLDSPGPRRWRPLTALDGYEQALSMQALPAMASLSS
jgi:hypothetical protein